MKNYLQGWEEASFFIDSLTRNDAKKFKLKHGEGKCPPGEHLVVREGENPFCRKSQGRENEPVKPKKSNLGVILGTSIGGGLLLAGGATAIAVAGSKGSSSSNSKASVNTGTSAQSPATTKPKESKTTPPSATIKPNPAPKSTTPATAEPKKQSTTPPTKTKPKTPTKQNPVTSNTENEKVKPPSTTIKHNPATNPASPSKENQVIKINPKSEDWSELSPSVLYNSLSNSLLENKIDEIEKKIRQDSIESLFSIGTQSSIENKKIRPIIHFSAQGAENNVSVDENELDRIYNKNYGIDRDAIFLHNHPALFNNKMLINPLKLTEEKIQNGDFPAILMGHSFSNTDILSSKYYKMKNIRVTTLAYDYTLEMQDEYPDEIIAIAKSKRYNLKIPEHEQAFLKAFLNMCEREVVEKTKLISQKYGHTNTSIEIRLEYPQFQKYSQRTFQESDKIIVPTFDFSHETITLASQRLGWKYQKMRNSTSDTEIKNFLLNNYGGY